MAVDRREVLAVQFGNATARPPWGWLGSHQTCPYSKATRGNIDVTINLV